MNALAIYGAAALIQTPELGDINNTVESVEDLIALEKAFQNPLAVPMPAHVRAKIERILNLPPVYVPNLIEDKNAD